MSLASAARITSYNVCYTKLLRFLHGPASACNLARLTQVPVPGHALVYLLRGEAPLLARDPQQPATISWQSG